MKKKNPANLQQQSKGHQFTYGSVGAKVGGLTRHPQNSLFYLGDPPKTFKNR